MTNVGSSVSHPLLKAEKKARVAPSGVDRGSVGVAAGAAVDAGATDADGLVGAALFAPEPRDPRPTMATTTTATTARAMRATTGRRYFSFIGLGPCGGRPDKGQRDRGREAGDTEQRDVDGRGEPDRHCRRGHDRACDGIGAG